MPWLFTEKMLDMLIDGMGSDVDVKKFYPHEMNISPCTSCYSCRGKKFAGVCVKNDDFNEILEPAQVKSARGSTEHPKRFNSHPKVVMISSCGFPETGNFDIVSRYFRKICEEAHRLFFRDS